MTSEQLLRAVEPISFYTPLNQREPLVAKQTTSKSLEVVVLHGASSVGTYRLLLRKAWRLGGSSF